MSVSAGILAGVGAASSIGGAAIGASAAGNAASTQANAADYAANLQAQEAQNALNFQEQVYNNQQQLEAPWLGVGQSGLANLANLLGIMPGNMPPGAGSPTGAGGGLPMPQGGPVPAPGQSGSTGMPPWLPRTSLPGGSGGPPMAGTFSLPSGSAPGAPGTPGAAPVPGTGGITAANPTSGLAGLSKFINPNLGAAGSLMQGWNQQFTAPQLNNTTDPGYQARLNLAQQAIQNSAAARGGLLSGNTLNAENQFTQDYASNEYSNVYNRALQGFNTNYNVFQQNQANEFNRLAAMAGVGQTAVQQLGTAGQSAAGNVSNTLLNAGSMIGGNINNAGAARGSGYVGAGNAYAGGLNNLGNLASLYAILNQGGNSPVDLSGIPMDAGLPGIGIGNYGAPG